MHTKSLSQLSLGLQTGEFSSVELTQAFIKRIKQHQDLNAYITITEELALQNAQLADTRIANKKADALTGIPVAQKCPVAK